MTRVLSTDQARAAVGRMAAIVNGGLAEQIAQLTTQGQMLSQPDVWDGATAARFRTTWADTERVLRDMSRQLEELRRQVQQVNDNIMLAGGNAV